MRTFFAAPFALVCMMSALAHAQAPTPPATDAPAAPAMDDAARRAQVVARVGSTSITLGQLEDEINHMSPFMRARYRDPAQLREYATQTIRLALLAREAERRGFGEDPEVVDAVRQASVMALIRHDFDERITAATIPADEVRAYYEEHPAEFNQPEMRRASQLVVATREEAEGLLAQAQAADARAFRQLVTDHSVDLETRVRGGDLRYFDAEGHTPNSSDPAVPTEAAQAAFALTNVGDVSGVFAEGDRFGILMLTGQRPAEHHALGEAEQSIRTRLWRTTRQTALETFVEELRQRIPTEVFYDRMRNIHMDPPERLSEDPAAAASDEAQEAADPDDTAGIGPAMEHALSPDQALGGPPASGAPAQ
jgi:peptidyl-prolyl cis-trans isomerase C